MKLAFCDDEISVLNRIRALLDQYRAEKKLEIDYVAFQSPLEFSQGLGENGMASKELRLLEAGDVITTIWKLASYSGDDDFEMYTVEEITVDEDTSFGEAPLSDGSYSMVFEMWDAAGNYAYSDPVIFECTDGEILTTVFEE